MSLRLATSILAVALLAAACSEAPQTAGPGSTAPQDGTGSLDGTSWVVTSFGIDGSVSPVLPGAVPTIAFTGSDASGTTGCNSWSSTVHIGDGSVTFGGVGMTEMACLNTGVLAQEQRFAQALGGVARYSLDGDTLVLESADGLVRIEAEASAPSQDRPLAGSWRLTTFVDGDTASSLSAGTEITLNLERATVSSEDGIEDWTVSGSAGCNDYAGSATTHGSDLQVSDLVSTLRACEQPIMDQERRFLGTLAAAASVSVTGDTLTITAAGGRSLIFS